jgi:hypothetical protein
MKLSELEDANTIVTEAVLKTAMSRLKSDLETERLNRTRERNHEKFEFEMRQSNLVIGLMLGAVGGFTAAMILFTIFFHH